MLKEILNVLLSKNTFIILNKIDITIKMNNLKKSLNIESENIKFIRNKSVTFNRSVSFLNRFRLVSQKRKYNNIFFNLLVDF